MAPFERHLPAIRVLVVDDHPAIRAGLIAVLDAEPGIVPVGCATGEHDLWPALNTTRPDVVILDYHLIGRDGLRLCRQIKATLMPPKVLIYSVQAGERMTLPAILAGADGLLEKGAPIVELCQAIHLAAGGGRPLTRPTDRLIAATQSQVSPADAPIIELLAEGATPMDIATTLGTDVHDISVRVDRILAALTGRSDASSP
jgi:DNA-binding NarL/FixJ family response regulator